MTQDQALREFAKQFEFEPVIENAGNFRQKNKWIVCGMGGSHLAADLLNIFEPPRIMVHSDYGLPDLGDLNVDDYLVIASSYSGNTEETLDSFDLACAKNFSVAAVSIGGKLLESAKKRNVPFVRLPDAGIQPRAAVGYSLRAILKLTGNEKNLIETKKLVSLIDNSYCEKEGKKLAEKLIGRSPIIYASRKNQPLAYNWKIKFNETAKIPAFYNVFPELNHNEMTGFDAVAATEPLSSKFYFIFLRDSNDHPKILKRMELTAELFEKRGLPVEILELKGENQWHRIFSNLLIADWAAYFTALNYGVEPEFVPMVEEFKKLAR